MKLSILKVLRPPFTILILLVFVTLLLPSVFIQCWYTMIKHVEHDVNMNFLNFNSELQLEIERIEQLLHPINASASNLVEAINSSTNGYNLQLSFVEIQNKVYQLAIPQNEVPSVVHKYSRMALILVIITCIMMVVSVLSFGLMIVGLGRQEMHLSASLMKQMEATRQAERKSMKKTLALVSFLRDIRASLTDITGLIENCYDGVEPRSQLFKDLKYIHACINIYVSGTLNSVFVDTNKLIEAGKMKLHFLELQEETFDVAKLVEEAIENHSFVSKKGMKVVLDHSSIIKFSKVKGDKEKFCQILNNVLSNAFKFTPKHGHVTVRAWVRKPSPIKNSVNVTLNRINGLLRHLCCTFGKNKELEKEVHDDDDHEDDPNVMDFVFEVDDTGIGIPKEKQKEVFENFVRFEDGALEGGNDTGTGLGLSIVQSLVRLMHGEIRIVEKEMGERGSCFRFNVLLSVSPQPADHTNISKPPVPVDDDEHEIAKVTGQPLSGKNILVTENGVTGLRIRHIMLPLGAIIEFCRHEWQAIDLVQKNLGNQIQHTEGVSTILPYDYILMETKDMERCREVTRKIRKMEEFYGIHIGIIGFAFRTIAEEDKERMIKAGMDVCLCKLTLYHLMEAIRKINDKNKDLLMTI